MSKLSLAGKDEAVSKILEHVRRGDTLYLIRRTPRPGDRKGTQRIGFYAADHNSREGPLVRITDFVAVALGESAQLADPKHRQTDPDGGVVVTYRDHIGTGTLGYQAVQELSEVLFGELRCLYTEWL